MNGRKYQGVQAHAPRFQLLFNAPFVLVNCFLSLYFRIGTVNCSFPCLY